MVLSAGAEGVGKVFQMMPCIMRCKPTQHDRWERRVIELAAYQFCHGHANVPEVSSTQPHGQHVDKLIVHGPCCSIHSVLLSEYCQLSSG